MKKSCLTCLAFILVILSACSRDGQGVAPRSYFCAELNGQAWEGVVSASINSMNELNIGVNTYADRKKRIARGSLTVEKIPIQALKQSLKPLKKDSVTLNILGTGYSTLKEDGDVLDGRYALVLSDSANNYIELTEVDLKRKRFKGEFSGTYVKTNNPTGLASDTMRFRNGKFFIKLRD